MDNHNNSESVAKFFAAHKSQRRKDHLGLVRYKNRLCLVRLFLHWLRDLEELAGPSLHDLSLRE